MGLKARLKRWISVEIVNFLLINILLRHIEQKMLSVCLLYTSDAADDMQCVDLGGRRIIKKVAL